MIEHELKALEAQSRLLEPVPDARAVARDACVAYAERFLNELPQRKAFEVNDEEPGDHVFSIGEAGGSLDDALRIVAECIDYPGLNPASGGHLAYIPGGGIYYSALADYLAAVTNRYAGIFYAAPGAVRMENALLRWMASLVGYPATAAGNLASGGSIANLSAIVTARDASGLPARDWHRAVIYSTDHAHHCLDKAYRIAGLGEAVKRRVPMDSRFRMDASALQELIAADVRDGLKPWLVVASAGSTDVGAIDPLNAIADVAQQYRLWFHVDAAYGGFFILTDEGRRKLAGIERSDSVVMDPHKGLFLPYGIGAVIVRDGTALRRSHQYTAAYMQDAAARSEEWSPADLSPELTKHFRGLRLWLPLKLHGLAPFRACLQEKLLLARYFHEQISRTPGFEVLNEPELSVVAFRYVDCADPNAFNKALQEAIRKDGRVFLSSSTIDGKTVLRMAILAFRTHLETVQLALRILNENVQLLKNGRRPNQE